MKHTVNRGSNHITEYQGIMPFDVRVLNTIVVSNATPKTATRLLAMVPNEGVIDYWIVDVINTEEALKALAQYYIDEEQWVDISRIALFSFVETPHFTQKLVTSLVNEKKIVKNEQHDRYDIRYDRD
jgi:hypothetical protein